MKATGFTKQEPVLAGTAALWLLTQVGTLVVTKEHWLGAAQWGQVTHAAVPIVTSLVLAVFGWLTRRVVTPAWSTQTPMPLPVATPSAVAEAASIFPAPGDPRDPRVAS